LVSIVEFVIEGATLRNVILLVLLSELLLFGCAWKDNAKTVQSTAVIQPASYDFNLGSMRNSPENLDEKSNFFKRSAIVPTKIAMLVPLSGPYKDLGQNLLDAAQLALFSIDEPNLILVPFDTKGTSFGAVEAANQAFKEDVKLILGPVFSKSASAIATLAKEHGINVVSFSNDKSLAGTGVFSIGFSPEQQIRRITEFAIAQGIEEFTTVLPNDAYGATAAQQLRETISENKNTDVLKTEIFRIDNNGEPLQLKESVDSALSAALNTKSSKDFDEKTKTYNDNPIKYPRGMFIPEGGKQLESITSLLQEGGYDGNKIQLIGSGQWYYPGTLQNPTLENSWFAGPPHEQLADFESKFESIYGYKPLNIAGLAYDGVALAATLARSSNGHEFSRESIADPKGFVGVDGIFRFRSDGLTDRGLAVMTIKNGAFETISPAPTSFVGFKEYISKSSKHSSH
jgi:branched-chain amino acid transport system substrate-binding protein